MLLCRQHVNYIYFLCIWVYFSSFAYIIEVLSLWIKIEFSYILRTINLQNKDSVGQPCEGYCDPKYFHTCVFCYWEWSSFINYIEISLNQYFPLHFGITDFFSLGSTPAAGKGRHLWKVEWVDQRRHDGDVWCEAAPSQVQAGRVL